MAIPKSHESRFRRFSPRVLIMAISKSHESRFRRFRPRLLIMAILSSHESQFRHSCLPIFHPSNLPPFPIRPHCRRSILLRGYVHRNCMKNRDLEIAPTTNRKPPSLNHGNPFITRITVQTFPSSILPIFHPSRFAHIAQDLLSIN